MTSKKPSNLVLIGFMASGKTRIGEHLAKTLGYDLIDTDAVIEQESGQTIQQIFDKKGEYYFRQLEADTVKRLKEKTRLVIVTGGGTPIFFDNAHTLRDLGTVFFLDASLPVITSRLNRQDRPLGKVETKEDYDRLKELYMYRRPVYAHLGHRIDVNHRDKKRTCQEIIEIFLANERLLSLSKTIIHDILDSYPIYHQKNSLLELNTIINACGLKNYQAVLITSDRLNDILATTIGIMRQSLGDIPLITMKDGEHFKNLTSVSELHDQMFRLGLTRKTLVLALGGGNVGDVAGFASSIYMRGLPFIQIPTTLLSMVDASIGGKTGVDNPFGKNLIGSFHQPKAVVIDPELLKSMPKDDFASGMAEIIKHAIIADKELFYLLKDQDLDLNNVIERALKVKADIVFNDPHENNIRAYLNFGHTVAHAIERVSNYTIKHGQAVAMGLVAETKLSKRLGILKEDFLSDLEQVLKKFHLPTRLPASLSLSSLLEAMKFDKKRDHEGLKFILPIKLGEVCQQAVSEQDIF